MKQYGFFVDTTKCSGCKTCQLSCKDEKDLSIGPKFRRVYEYTGGSWVQSSGAWYHDVFSYYLSIACNHCLQPTCVKGCPTGAMHKRPQDGLVVVNAEICIGCRTCEMRCPYGAPQFDADNKIMTKCDGCYQRVAEGLKPVCVDSCPQRALDFDEMAILQDKYGPSEWVAPLPNPDYTHPNLIVRAHPDARPLKDAIGTIINPQEV